MRIFVIAFSAQGTPDSQNASKLKSPALTEYLIETIGDLDTVDAAQNCAGWRA
jgi:hypothetical protein